MIKMITIDSKVSGFVYYPILEIGTGVFLMICSLSVPILFIVYNGIKPEQWKELLFCLFFLILFLFMGKSLTFQTMRVEVKGENVYFYQNLREPPTEFIIPITEWLGIFTCDEEINNQINVVLFIKEQNSEREFYRSVNRNEINKICDALIALKKAG